jgi:hypothetical protein
MITTAGKRLLAMQTNKYGCANLYVPVQQGCRIAAAWPTSGRPYSGKPGIQLTRVHQLVAPEQLNACVE